MTKLDCFKAYDVRGKLGSELDEGIAYRIGRAFGQFICPESVVIGGDVRASSEKLKLSLSKGLLDSGVNVVDIGTTGTEEVYFATKYLDVDGGIEVTASHNPIDYNGMKFVGKGAKPISGDNDLKAIQKLAEKNTFTKPSKLGKYKKFDILPSYVNHLLTYIRPENLSPLKLVVNSGNGTAGHVIDSIEQQFRALNVPIQFIKIHHEPDPTFPNGIPNPLLVENREDTSASVIEHKADMGIAWDGDFDRCFLFDENGVFVEGYYIVGLLAEAFLKKNPNEKIIHDPRLTWNTIDIVNNNSGTPILSKTGHAFIKERMRKEDAIYGGEMSAHHYFRDFAYCDSGMIPWLMVAELISLKKKPLSDLVGKRIALYPASGEINLAISNPEAVIRAVEDKYRSSVNRIDYTDGLTMEFNSWRFNLRTSNTEPLVRLNVESFHDSSLMQTKTDEIISFLQDTIS